MSSRLENIFLYSLCTLIWGSTWFVITLQVDAASPVSSVFWRFLLASAILFFFCLFKKHNLQYSKREHLIFASQGIFLFSVNYILNYTAETMTSSGLVAMTFTTLIYFNIFGMRLFFNREITKSVIMGAALGGIGILFIFLNEILYFNPSSATLLGLALGVIATFAASIGNMIAQKSYKMRIPILVSNAFSMFYGSFFTLLIALFKGEHLAIPLTPRFLAALFYLIIFGSVIAFGAYLSLAGRIGAEKAGYTSILSPVIALILSSFFENFKWTPYIVFGVLLCIAGNVVILMRRSSHSAN